MSLNTSAVLLLSNPLAVKRAYSSSATLELSTLTAFVSLIPKVSDACPPISDNTSEALRPSIEVPDTLRKSSSATPLVNTGMFPFDIPVVAIDDAEFAAAVALLAAAVALEAAFVACVEAVLALVAALLAWVDAVSLCPDAVEALEAAAVADDAAFVADVAADTASTRSAKWSVSVRLSPTTESATHIYTLFNCAVVDPFTISLCTKAAVVVVALVPA